MPGKRSMKICQALQQTVALILLSLCGGSAALAAPIDLPQTGQTTCYDSAGGVIDCTNTGQDGDWKAGVPWSNPRFVSGTGLEAECMVDRLTGLMWSKNANLAGVKKSWLGAISYANDLTYCGHSNWHLPNVNELESLIDAEVANSSAKRYKIGGLRYSIGLRPGYDSFP
jgi:hypothetical protein